MHEIHPKFWENGCFPLYPEKKQFAGKKDHPERK
jgi:hypothetical protein